MSLCVLRLDDSVFRWLLAVNGELQRLGSKGGRSCKTSGQKPLPCSSEVSPQAAATFLGRPSAFLFPGQVQMI